ncbi:MAG: RHS repeat-associated core domain-containing protein [Paludibacteraceae bacterium]|nr:RHS repeat-associated core domain-containing protein [Paludibacteraceae bacterium]
MPAENTKFSSISRAICYFVPRKSYRGRTRFHRWNDFDRLIISIGHDFCGNTSGDPKNLLIIGEEGRMRVASGCKASALRRTIFPDRYDADGIRTYKLMGTCNISTQNGGDLHAQAVFDDAVLYPSPYMVVTPKGYTNHYYAGSERIASRIGDRCWTITATDDWEKPAPETEAREAFWNIGKEEYPFGDEKEISSPTTNVAFDEDYDQHVQYSCNPIYLPEVDVLSAQDMLKHTINCVFSYQNNAPVYYYHPDHLGSTSWVTDESGNEQQFLAYLPYGEPLMDVHLKTYDGRHGPDDIRYKFTGKERDRETGYDYMEQRYYYPPLSIWLRPDPLLDKYIQSSPYAYCDGNPLIYIDPEGMDIFRYDNETGDFKLEQKTDDNFDLVGKFKYDKKKGNFVLRTRKDGSFKTYTDHLGNNDKIAKGILFDGLNIKQNGHDFNVDKSAEHTLSDFFNFALILDEITGREISGFVLESFEDQKEQIVRFEPYNKNKYNKSITTLYNLSGKQRAIYHFHTHGQADSKIEAITPSEDRDIPAKTKITSFYPNIQLLILHNYGVPIKY